MREPHMAVILRARILTLTNMPACAHRLRAHEAMQLVKHETALHNLEQAAGHCARAGGGGLTNLDAVADFIRSEIAGNFRFDGEVKDDPASWVSRAAAGLLLLGVLLHLLLTLVHIPDLELLLTWGPSPEVLCHFADLACLPAYVIHASPYYM